MKLLENIYSKILIFTFNNAFKYFSLALFFPFITGEQGMENEYIDFFLETMISNFN